MDSAYSMIEQFEENKLKREDEMFDSIKVKFEGLIEAMRSEGEFTGSVDLTLDEAHHVGDFMHSKRGDGFRFRLDRLVTRKVNGIGVEIAEDTEEFSLFVSLEHLR